MEIIGRNAVRELLASGRDVDKILVQKGEKKGSIVALVAIAVENRIPVVETDKAKLDEIAGQANHQGIIAYASEKEYCTVEDILASAKAKGEKPFLLVCDNINDPYNLGAMIRTADCCGVHGIIIPKRHSVGITSAVTKTSAGAVEYMPIAKVANITATLEKLKDAGLWIYGAEAGGESVYKTDFSTGVAVVMGSEGEGISPLVKKTCDYIVSIPMYGNVNSFNVSNATAIVLSEVARRRHEK